VIPGLDHGMSKFPISCALRSTQWQNSFFVYLNFLGPGITEMAHSFSNFHQIPSSYEVGPGNFKILIPTDSISLTAIR